MLKDKTTRVEFADLSGRTVRRPGRYLNLDDLHIFLLQLKIENPPSEALDIVIENVERIKAA